MAEFALQAVRFHVNSIADEVVTNLMQQQHAVLFYLSIYAFVHITVQYVIPAISPSVYDFTSKVPVDRKTLAVRMRTRVISMGMAIFVTYLGFQGYGRAEEVALKDRLYESTETTRQLVEVAVAHFIWDIIICVLDGESFAFHVHGWSCFLVFSCALRPFAHYMSTVALIFEASTPFMHLRKLMIEAGTTEGKWFWPFMIIQTAFGLTFFAVRICIGYKESYGFFEHMLAFLESGGCRNRSVVYLYLGLCILLCSLNAIWLYQIVSVAAKCGKKSKSKGSDDFKKE